MPARRALARSRGHGGSLAALGLLVASMTSAPLLAASVELLANGEMLELEERRSAAIPNHTTYEWVEDDEMGTVLEAVADGSSSALLYKRDLPFTPQARLEVTYKVVSASTNESDERTKAGDDFPLRLYIVRRRMLLFRQVLVLVHSLRNEVGSGWLNPYSNDLAEFRMHAIAGKETGIGQWRHATIEVGRIWREVFGDGFGTIEGIALMVDSDNGGGKMVTRIAKLAYEG